MIQDNDFIHISDTDLMLISEFDLITSDMIFAHFSDNDINTFYNTMMFLTSIMTVMSWSDYGQIMYTTWQPVMVSQIMSATVNISNISYMNDL